jgi:hypothetical protein
MRLKTRRKLEHSIIERNLKAFRQFIAFSFVWNVRLCCFCRRSVFFRHYAAIALFIWISLSVLMALKVLIALLDEPTDVPDFRCPPLQIPLPQSWAPSRCPWASGEDARVHSPSGHKCVREPLSVCLTWSWYVSIRNIDTFQWHSHIYSGSVKSIYSKRLALQPCAYEIWSENIFINKITIHQQLLDINL